MAEVRNDDVLACYRYTKLPDYGVTDLRLEPTKDLSCRACTKAGELRVSLTAQRSCPRCHAFSLYYAAQYDP